MFGKFMNNYYYGKSGKGDYTPEDLPKTRMQLFFEMLRVRLSALCRMNLLYMLPFLPTMLVIGMLVMYVLTMGAVPTEEKTITNADGTVTTQIVAVEMTEEEQMALLDQQAALVPSMLNTTLILLIPCIFITGPWTAGVSYVVRNWARDEHAFIWSDMKDAMKENWKPALGLSAITSVVPLLAWTCWRFYGSLAGDSWFMVIPQMFTLLIAVVWFLAITYAYPMLVTYKMSFGTIIRNSLLLAIGRLPMSVGIRLLHLVPTILCLALTFLLGSIWIPVALFGYYMLIGFTLSRFVTASYTNAQFDKFINNRIEGAEVGRGLAEEDDEDYEEEEEERELKPWENGYVSQDK
ncbi:MAG: YesL family protein [Clostridia bacterium]|nr:YesL family protein [Clostridia bacterium]